MSKTIRVAAASDLHGQLPEVPECDLLLLGGDYTKVRKQDYAGEAEFFRIKLAPWLERVPARQIVAVSGNHDFILQDRKDLLPPLRWTYLQDSGVTFEGLRIWGSPWQKRFHDWAFNEDEHRLAGIWRLIPQDTDILVLHGPPYGYGDAVPGRTGPLGSESLLERIMDVRPRLAVYGHIHSGYGQYQIPGPPRDTLLANVAVSDEQYRLANPVFVTDMEVG